MLSCRRQRGNLAYFGYGKHQILKVDSVPEGLSSCCAASLVVEELVLRESGTREAALREVHETLGKDSCWDVGHN